MTDTTGKVRSEALLIRPHPEPMVWIGAEAPMARKGIFLIPWLFLAGCATAPSHDAQYLETAEGLHAAAHGELATPATLPPEPELGGPHPVAFYLQIALERNPEILAAQRNVAAKGYEIPQVTALEDPMLTNTFWPVADHSPQTASGRMPYSLMATQQFPWLGKLRLQGEVAEQETKIALTELAQAQLEVIESVQMAYYEVYYYQKAIAVTEENETLLEDVIRFAEIRFRTGGSQQDVLRAQLERDRLRERLIGFRRDLRMAQSDLIALLHATLDVKPLAMDDLDVPEAPEAIEFLYETAVRCRPELQARLHAIVRDQRSRELAALDYYPDFTAGVSWDLMTTDQAISPVSDGKDNVGFVVGVSVPIWRDRIEAGITEAEHRAVESARRYDATRDDTFRQIRRLIAQADAAQKQRDLFEESILPKIEQTLKVSIADYRVGKVEFLQVIDNYSELLTFQIQLARLQTNLGQAIASLERVIGCQLAMLPEPMSASEPPPATPAPAPAKEPKTDPSNTNDKDPPDDQNALKGDSMGVIAPVSFASIDRSGQEPTSSCRPVKAATNVLSFSPTEPDRAEPKEDPMAAEEDATESKANGPIVYEPYVPVLGAGYLPYAYPGFDACPCASEFCFPPSRYCDPCYREEWFRKWLKAHLGHGSMRADVPCPCIEPATGRPILLPVSQPVRGRDKEPAPNPPL